MLNVLLKGMLIGFSIAMPVGPIGLLCIRHALNSGQMAALIAGLGAAFADAVYGAVAGFGLTSIGYFLQGYEQEIKVVAALFLCYLGVTTFFAKSKRVHDDAKGMIFLQTFLLTLTNPLTIVSFAGVFASLGIETGAAGCEKALTTTFGVFTGSLLWWIILSVAAAHFKERMTVKSYRLLNRLSGSLLFGYGIGALLPA